MPPFDTIVIGAGPNGLAASHRLAMTGAKVLVLERAGTPGGGAALSHYAYNFDPRVAQSMRLQHFGLAWETGELSTTALSRNGAHLRLEGPVGARLGGEVAEADRTAWEALRGRLLRYAALLGELKSLPPPRLARDAGNPMMRLGQIGLRARMMGADALREMGRILLTNVYDLLDDELSDPLLKGTLAFDATLGSWLGPRSPNSVLPWLYRLSGETSGTQGALGVPKGGMAALAAAMAKSADAAGVTIRCDAPVNRILVENGRAAGVVLGSGEELRAHRIVSSLDPVTTLLALVGPRHLDTGLVMRARHRKARGGAARLRLVLRSLPDFRGADPKDRLVIAPSAEDVERAFNPVKYGRVPERPVMEIMIPTAREAATTGPHILTATVQYAPHAPENRDAARHAMRAACIQVLEDHAPGLGALVESAELLMPYDIEAAFGLPGGNWHAGELSVEQMLFLRPLPGVAQYRAPIGGLWLASAGCHPGGGVSGSAGHNAALAIEQEAA